MPSCGSRSPPWAWSWHAISSLFKDLGTIPVVLPVVTIPAFIEGFGWRGFSRGIDPTLVWQIQGIVITVFAIALVLVSARMRRPLGEELVEDDGDNESSEQPQVQPAAI